MNYLKKVLRVHSIAELPELNTKGVLVVSDNQEIIDECLNRNIPVAAYEHDVVSGLKCEHIFLDIDEIDDDEFENVYRRQRGIPLDITTTARTYIREFCMKDLDKLFELYAKPKMTEYMEPLYPYDEERAYQRNYINYVYKVFGYGQWLVFDKSTDELIGRAGIENRETCVEYGQAELGYCIATDRWRQGYAFEVCTQVVAIAKQRYQLKSLIARCDKRNAASIGLLEKLGFTRTKEMSDDEFLYKRIL